MGVKSHLLGTTGEDWQIGLGENYGLDRSGSELRLRDACVATAVPMADLLGWRRVADGCTRTVLDGYDHVGLAAELQGTGGIALVGDGGLLLVGET